MRLIVSGVPGTISSDLVASAGEADHLEAGENVETDALKATIDALTLMMKRTTPPTGFWTIKLIDQWARDHRNGVPGSDPDKSNAISYMLRNGLMRRYKTVTDIREVTISELDETHPLVRGLLTQVGLELNPTPARCIACNECAPADSGTCPCCGATITLLWSEASE